MSKKNVGKFLAFATVAGAVAAGISYFLKYKSFHDELDEDFHDIEGEDESDGQLPKENEEEGKTRNYVTLGEKKETAQTTAEGAETAAENADDGVETAAPKADELTEKTAEDAAEVNETAEDTVGDTAEDGTEKAEDSAETVKKAATTIEEDTSVE